MIDDDTSTYGARGESGGPRKATVTNLATRRGSGDVLRSITFVFGGINYGTFPIATPYFRGKPIVLYIVPQNEAGRGNDLTGPLDCLVTDDPALGNDLEIAR